ncbi:MAG: DNA polymerase domain-containing protein [Candidatus Anstonellales archaeon]
MNTNTGQKGSVIKIPADFFSKVEMDSEYVVYGDTDSLYLNIKSIKPNSTEEAINQSKKISEDINKIIKDYLDGYFLPKSGVSKEYNCIDFKTEVICSAMILLDVKKNYVYRMIAKEGVILDKPKTKYVGIPVVRSDYSDLTRDMIRDVIESILDGSKPEKIASIISDYKKTMNKHISEYSFKYIGIPVKWAMREYVRDTAQIIGMKLYNILTGVEKFRQTVSGRRIPINILNGVRFTSYIHTKDGSDYISEIGGVDKIKFICIPDDYSPDDIKRIMNDSGIVVDSARLWDISYSKTLKRIVKLLEEKI